MPFRIVGKNIEALSDEAIAAANRGEIPELNDLEVMGRIAEKMPEALFVRHEPRQNVVYTSEEMRCAVDRRIEVRPIGDAHDHHGTPP